jgi:hypothetical protein
MTVLIRIDILLGFLINIFINNIKNNDLYIYAEAIDSNNIVTYSPLNGKSGECSSENNKEKKIKNDDEDTVMAESSNENEKFKGDNNEVDRVEHQGDNKETFVEEMK